MTYLLKTLTQVWNGSSNAFPPADSLSSDDCLSCTHPCDDHSPYPPSLNINTFLPMQGTVKPYTRHLLISTGQSDWATHIEESKGSIAQALDTTRQPHLKEQRILMTNTSAPTEYSTHPQGHDVLVLPDNVWVANVTVDTAEAFWTLLEQSQPMLPTQTAVGNELALFSNPHSSLVLICSHRKRDKRCGITAPILKTTLEDCLREKDISERGEKSVVVWMVSHIGGHKFAGNVICYTHQGTRGIWYGRVVSCDCPIIVEETLVKGKVIERLYRGAMTHSFDAPQSKLLW